MLSKTKLLSILLVFLGIFPILCFPDSIEFSLNSNPAPYQPLVLTSISLTSFTAHEEKNTVILEWKTVNEIDNQGFYLVKSESLDKGYIILNKDIIPAQGNANAGYSYTYIDDDVKAGYLYYYWLADMNDQGKYTIHGPISVELDSIAKYPFDTFVPWSKPIEDYKSFAEYYSNGELTDVYTKSINDLAPFGDKLWFGYGDANYNLGTKMKDYGRRCIEFRYFASPDDPVPFSSFESSEEQIDQYRILDGELWQAGIDAIDVDEYAANPAIQGNVYRLDGEQWIKNRSLDGGVHIHDLAFWQGYVYAVGSGAADLIEWNEGKIFRNLWRSRTDGVFFEKFYRVGHPEQQGKGDSRWIRLLPLKNFLYIFGYYSMFAENRTYVSNARCDGNDVLLFDDEHPDDVMNVFAYGTQPLPDGTGLLWGVAIATEQGNYYALWHLDGDGKATQLETFDNKSIIDVYFHPETEELIYLIREELANQYTAKILLADMGKPGETQEINQFTSDVRQVSIAFWQGKMFLGMNNCEIYKSGNPPHAQFTVTPKTGKVWTTIFNVDATQSSDNQDPTPVLKVRWQWEKGAQYTEWSTIKKTQHRYPSSGTKTITLQVKDLDGEIASTSQDVTVTE